MALSGSRLAREVFRKALALHQKLSKIDKEKLHPFFVVFSREGPVFFALPGTPDKRLRITFVFIPQELVERDSTFLRIPQEEFARLDRFQFAVIPGKGIPGDWVRLLKRGGFHLTPESEAPFLFIQDEEGQTYTPNTKSLRVFFDLLNGTLLAMKKGLFQVVRPILFKEPPVVALQGDPLGSRVEVVFPWDLEDEEAREEPEKKERAVEAKRDKPYSDRRFPAPDDLEGWKEADRALTNWFFRIMNTKDIVRPRALKRFFGSLGGVATLLEENPGAADAFVEWLFVDYRAVSRSRTLAEKMLEGGMPPAFRTLLEARAEALPSIYQVQEVDQEGTLLLSDIFSGNRVTVWDPGLSKGDVKGLFTFARVYRAGSFHFLQLFAPLVDRALLDGGLAFLDRLGMEYAPEERKKKVHLFGRLWTWYEAEIRKSETYPVLTNTDGDPLVQHSASFKVAEPEVLARALDRRKDMDADMEPGSWTWFRPLPPGSSLVGERLSLGSLRLFGDEILLEVNSERRYLRGRAILEKIPGVTFQGLKKTPITRESLEDLPMDDRLPGPPESPLPEEILKVMKEKTRELYMKWLDEPIPALKGKTPRQACATEEGRVRVAGLIRAIPPSFAPGGVTIHAPKEEMLRELGLGEA